LFRSSHLTNPHFLPAFQSIPTYSHREGEPTKQIAYTLYIQKIGTQLVYQTLTFRNVCSSAPAIQSPPQQRALCELADAKATGDLGPIAIAKKHHVSRECIDDIRLIQLAAIADALSEFIELATPPPSTGRILFDERKAA
jgi:hypothetical protein